MRRIALWCLSTFSVLVLLFGYSTSTSGPTTAGAPPAVYSGTLSDTPADSPSTSPPSTGSTSSPATTDGAASAAVGEVATTQWGPVQVQLTTQGSSITQVDVLQYPSGNQKDAEINAYALPILVQETLDAQSADIDMVSGATVTSVGYQQSLQSAIDQAGL